MVFLNNCIESFSDDPPSSEHSRRSSQSSVLSSADYCDNPSASGDTVIILACSFYVLVPYAGPASLQRRSINTASSTEGDDFSQL